MLFKLKQNTKLIKSEGKYGFKRERSMMNYTKNPMQINVNPGKVLRGAQPELTTKNTYLYYIIVSHEYATMKKKII